MKKVLSLFVFVLILHASISVFAADIAALDKVNVLMPRERVVSILGIPQVTISLAKGLSVEVYPVERALPLTHAGCIYDPSDVLMGQSFVFQGREATRIAERIRKYGFKPLPKQEGSQRFAGFDDDTGWPLVAVIAEKDDMTTITTFEKNFYEVNIQ
jgi:hypothetical protein